MEWTQSQIDNFSTAEQLLFNANQSWTEQQINNFSTTEMLIYQLQQNSNGGDQFVSLNDPRIISWNYQVHRFHHFVHNCNANYYYYDALDTQCWGGPLLSAGTSHGYPGNGWNGFWTVAIPTIGERMKIRGFFFSSFEDSNQGIYTRLRATGSPSIDSPDQWYRMWTEKEVPQSKIDILNGISYGGYNPGITSSSPASISVDANNYIKMGDVVILSISLSFNGIDVGIETNLSFTLPILSSYLNQHFNAQYSFSDNNAFSNVYIQKTKNGSVDVSFISNSVQANKLELSIKYRI